MTSESDLLLARGLAMREAGDAGGAARCFRLALARDPAAESAAVAALSLAEVLAETGRVKEAVEAGRQAEALRPEWRGLHNARGLALLRDGKPAEATTAFQLAMALDVADPMIPNNLGGALLRLDRPEEALEAFSRAVELAPAFLEARTNLGVALHRLGRLDEAVRVYEETLALAPDYAEAHWNLALSLIALGDLRRGFEEYEWRWRSPSFPEKRRAFPGAIRPDENRPDEIRPDENRPGEARPGKLRLGDLQSDELQPGKLRPGEPKPGQLRSAELRPGKHRPDELRPGELRAGEIQPDELRSGEPWQGQPLAGRTLFVQAEQGLGDCVQFVRYAALAARQGAEVVLEAPPRLMRLLASAEGVSRLVARGEPAPACDFHVPLMSLPRFFPADLSAVPAEVPYLRPPAGLVERVRARMSAQAPGQTSADASDNAFRIGVAWAGSPGNADDAARSCPPELFAPLAALPGVRLYGLQHGPAAERGKALLPLDDLDARSADFAESAAVMHCLDLIVSVDTSVVHVAGALGLPVWTLLSHSPDWRWMRDRDDSPWYPTMRLYRQERPGDWEGVMRRVAKAAGEAMGEATGKQAKAGRS